jgi:redox-sensing transcriptional repressor
MEERQISKAVIKRLPRYYRYLGEILDSGMERISSGELSSRMKVTASQIRQDLNHFGGFGQQGYGYNVKYLHDEIGKILGIDRCHNMIVVGGGNMGHALSNYTAFERNGFKIKGIFDVNPALIGKKIRNIEIHSTEELPEFIKKEKIEIAALTLPTAAAPKMADILVSCGIKAIWNFAPVHLDVPEHILVQSENMANSLAVLSMHLRAQMKDKK